MCKAAVEANGDTAGGRDQLRASSHGRLAPFCQLPCIEEMEMFVYTVKMAYWFNSHLPQYFFKAAVF